MSGGASKSRVMSTLCAPVFDICCLLIASLTGGGRGLGANLRVRGGDEPIPAAVCGVFVVVLGRQRRQRGGQLVGEPGARVGRGKANVGVERERRQALL